MMNKILLSGDGGQGIQLLSYLVTTAAFNNGKEVSAIPNYGLEQRGGVSLSFVKISDNKIAYPKFTKPDLLFVMSMQARHRTEDYRQEGVDIIDIDDYEDMLCEKDINVRSWNIFFMGMITKKLEEKNIIKKEEVFKLLEAKLSTKPGWETNKQAFNLGYDY